MNPNQQYTSYPDVSLPNTQRSNFNSRQSSQQGNGQIQQNSSQEFSRFGGVNGGNSMSTLGSGTVGIGNSYNMPNGGYDDNASVGSMVSMGSNGSLDTLGTDGSVGYQQYNNKGNGQYQMENNKYNNYNNSFQVHQQQYQKEQRQKQLELQAKQQQDKVKQQKIDNEKLILEQKEKHQLESIQFKQQTETAKSNNFQFQQKIQDQIMQTRNQQAKELEKQTRELKKYSITKTRKDAFAENDSDDSGSELINNNTNSYNYNNLDNNINNDIDLSNYNQINNSYNDNNNQPNKYSKSNKQQYLQQHNIKPKNISAPSNRQNNEEIRIYNEGINRKQNIPLSAKSRLQSSPYGPGGNGGSVGKVNNINNNPKLLQSNSNNNMNSNYNTNNTNNYQNENDTPPNKGYGFGKGNIYHVEDDLEEENGNYSPPHTQLPALLSHAQQGKVLAKKMNIKKKKKVTSSPYGQAALPNRKKQSKH
jgi:hypothetical protein